MGGDGPWAGQYRRACLRRRRAAGAAAWL